MEQSVFQFACGANEEVRVSLKKIRGDEWIDLRVYAAPAQGSAPVPTGKGLLLRAKDFSFLKQSVERLENALKAEKKVE